MPKRGTSVGGRRLAGDLRRLRMAGRATRHTLRSDRLEAGAVGTAEEAVEVLLDQRHVDDPRRGGGAAGDGGERYHLLAGLDGADAVPLGVDERGTGHLVAATVAVGAPQRDRRAGDRGDLTVLKRDGLVTTAGLRHDDGAVHRAEQPAQGAWAAEGKRAAAGERAAAGRPHAPLALGRELRPAGRRGR